MTDILLYGAAQSGHSYKVVMALTLGGIPHGYVAIDLGLPRDRRPAAFRAASAYGEVPVLVENGAALAQSNAILLHLARRHGRFGAGDEAGWDRITQWLCWEANRIGFSVPNLRFARKLGADLPVAWLEARARTDLDRLDEALGDRDFICGAACTIADLSLAGYLFWLDQAELDIARWPAVAAWLGRIRALPGWIAPDEALAGSR